MAAEIVVPFDFTRPLIAFTTGSVSVMDDGVCQLGTPEAKVKTLPSVLAPNLVYVPAPVP